MRLIYAPVAGQGPEPVRIHGFDIRCTPGQVWEVKDLDYALRLVTQVPQIKNLDVAESFPKPYELPESEPEPPLAVEAAPAESQETESEAEPESVEPRRRTKNYGGKG